ncbi:MAG: hypothetical protein MJ120_00155 [Clostridia bacterium]|nr:hypothetical protein [Clostridia bacterium]
MTLTVKIILIIAGIFLAGTLAMLAYWMKDSEIRKEITKLIAVAESKTISGAEKMKFVVDEAYKEVNLFFATFFNKTAIEKIAQEIYNCFEEFDLNKNKSNKDSNKANKKE